MTRFLAAFVVIGAAASASALADDGPLGLYNPLGLYVGAGVGRSTLDQYQFDDYDVSYRRLDDNPVGWNAYVGIRPIPFLGAELEYLDFGSAHIGAGPQFNDGGLTSQFLGGETHDRAGALFAVGYLPFPLPFLEPFVKIGAARVWAHERYTGNYNDIVNVDGTPVGLVSVSDSYDRTGVAYGGGVQFRFGQVAVRAQYERISLDHQSDLSFDPSLLSAGVTWTF